MFFLFVIESGLHVPKLVLKPIFLLTVYKWRKIVISLHIDFTLCFYLREFCGDFCNVVGFKCSIV
jgi:hypothetical protein